MPKTTKPKVSKPKPYPKFSSDFFIVDVKQGRAALAKFIEAGATNPKRPGIGTKVPVQLTGYLDAVHSRDDGTSIEFSGTLTGVKVAWPEFAKVSEVKAGDKLVTDGDFTCMPADAVKVVRKDMSGGGLYVGCKDGRHFLDGQLDHDGVNAGRYVGLYKHVGNRSEA